MKRILTLMTATLVAGSFLLFGVNSTLPAAEEESDEAELHQEYTDMEELENSIDEEELMENPEEEIGQYDDEEHNYPDEQYQDDRG